MIHPGFVVAVVPLLATRVSAQQRRCAHLPAHYGPDPMPVTNATEMASALTVEAMVVCSSARWGRRPRVRAAGDRVIALRAMGREGRQFDRCQPRTTRTMCHAVGALGYGATYLTTRLTTATPGHGAERGSIYWPSRATGVQLAVANGTTRAISCGGLIV